MTSRGSTPDDPGTRRHADGPVVPDPRPPDTDIREIQDPYDLPFPDHRDEWPAGRPEYVIVIDQIRGPGQPPSLAELLDTTAPRTRAPQPEPDLEAEP